MSGIRKSTDVGLSNIERKALRGTEAQEAMLDYDEAQKAFDENRECSRKARLERETTTGPALSIQPRNCPTILPTKISLLYSNS